MCEYCSYVCDGGELHAAPVSREALRDHSKAVIAADYDELGARASALNNAVVYNAAPRHEEGVDAGRCATHVSKNYGNNA